VPEYGETRQVEIRFENWSRVPKIFVDGPAGPTASPHRYSANRLCVWYPSDPDDQKWIFEDGLLMLICLIQLHLFRETWWRETGGLDDDGEWLGPQAPHESPKEEIDEDGHHERDQPNIPRRS
jgi:hypothetical protein